MPGPDYGWINELNPLGPPADADNNTPTSATALEDFKDFIESYAEGYTQARISADATLAGNSATVAASQSAIRTYIANNTASGGGFTYASVQDTSSTEGAQVVAGMGGGTSLTGPLQTIINREAGNNTVYFPPGVYGVGPAGGIHGLQLPSNTHLLLSPQAELRGLGPTTAEQQSIIRNVDWVNGNNNIVIEGGFINGNGLVGNGIVRFAANDSHRCSNIKVLNVEIANCNNQGLKFDNAQYFWIEGCRVHGHNADGIYIIEGIENAVIRGNLSYDNGDDDIALNASITSGVTSFAQRVVIADNICGYGTGERGPGQQNIAVRGGKEIVVANNVCHKSYGLGIYLANGLNGEASGNTVDIPLDGVVCIGNTIKQSGYSRGAIPGTQAVGAGNAIQVHTLGSNSSGCKRVTIANNFIHNPRGHGIILSGNSGQDDEPTLTGANLQDIKIMGNTIVWDTSVVLGNDVGEISATSNGITAVSGVSHVVGGTTYTNQAVILDVQAASNTVKNPPNIGMNFNAADGDVSRLKLNSNTVVQSDTGRTGSGIVVSGVEDVSVCGNECYDTKTTPTMAFGIDAQGCTGTLTLAENNCTWGGGVTTNVIRYDTAAATFANVRGNANKPDQTKP